MKTKSKLAITALILMSFNQIAYAQSEGSHGGSVMLCQDKVELAEFKEVRLRPGLSSKMKINYSEDSIEKQIQAAIDLLKKSDADVASVISTYIDAVRSKASPITGYDWGSSGDVNDFPQDVSGCMLKTAVYYFNDYRIEYRNDLYEPMSKTDKAGLWVHEAIYRLAREKSHIDKTRPVRRLVEQLFSKNPNQNLIGWLVKKYLKSPSEVSEMSSSINLVQLEPGHEHKLRVYTKNFTLAPNAVPSGVIIANEVFDDDTATSINSLVPDSTVYITFVQTVACTMGAAENGYSLGISVKINDDAGKTIFSNSYSFNYSKGTFGGRNEYAYVILIPSNVLLYEEGIL